MIAFDEVQSVHLPARAFDQLPVDRKVARYAAAAEWVRRILELESPALRAGEEDAPGLLFDINRLWEDVIATELRRQLAEHEIEVETQVTGRNLASLAPHGEPAVALRPDLVLSRRGRFIAVADTKWKRLEISRGGYLIPSPADVYQMLSYAAAFGCERLALIYPWHEGLSSARETTLILPPMGQLRPQLSIQCIDVTGERFVATIGINALHPASLMR